MGRGVIQGRRSLLGIYVGAIQLANAAYLDCGARGNNVLKSAESFPDRNHINCTKITGLQIINCSGKMRIHNVATVRPNRLSPRSEVIVKY